MSKVERLPALDGLRALSIALVVTSHFLEPAGLRFVPGGLGVTIFFFISGFIITRLLLAEDPRHGLLPFYLRRVFRLAPALLGFVVMSWLALKAFGMHMPGADAAAALLYYANYWNVYGPFHADGPHAVIPPLAVTWSLAVEEHFYMLFPLAVMAWRRQPERLLQALLAVAAASLAWRGVLVWHVGLEHLPANRIFMGTDTRLDSIAYGCIVSVLCAMADRGGATHAGARVLRWLAHPASVAAGVALLLSTLAVRSPAFRETLRYTAQGIALMPLFAWLFWRRARARALRAVLESRPMVKLGLLSYSLYLYHFLGLAVGEMLGAGHSPWLQIGLGLGFALVGTVSSYHLIEKPLRHVGAGWADDVATARREAAQRQRVAPSTAAPASAF